MAHIGSLDLNGMPRVAVGFSDADLHQHLSVARELGVDVAEVRIDQFSSRDEVHVVDKLRAFSGMPTIATIRAGDEGGEWREPEEARIALFRSIIAHVDAVDLELRHQGTIGALRDDLATNGKTLIVSHHDYAGTPTYDRLVSVVTSAKDTGANIVKIATMVKSDHDIRVLARVLIEHGDKDLIVIGMGAMGSITRLLFPSLGSLLTFAFCSTEQRTAPGQLPFSRMFSLLRHLYPKYNEEKINQLQMLECA